MRRWLLLSAAALLAVGVAWTPALASSATGPSERACLLAWNAQTNEAGRQRLVASGPWRVAVLRPAVVGRLRFGGGAPPQTTSGVGCSLMLLKQGRLQLVNGRWRDGRVRQWMFERPLATEDGPPVSNVRILADGRVTKLYRR